MICGEKSVVIYKLYGIAQFFEQTLQDNRILQLLELVQDKSSGQCMTYSDSRLR